MAEWLTANRSPPLARCQTGSKGTLKIAFRGIAYDVSLDAPWSYWVHLLGHSFAQIAMNKKPRRNVCELRRSAAELVWALFLAPLLSGCMSSGRVGDFAFSEDGRVLAFAEPQHRHLYVADARGLRWLAAHYCEFYLDQAGDRVVWLEDWGSPEPWPGTMAIHYVTDRRTRRVKIPQLTHVSSETGGRGIYFDPGGGIVLKATRFWRSDDQPARYIKEIKYLRWSAEGGWSERGRPPSKWVPAPNQSLEDAEVPLVEFGPDGWNARRTVWVRLDGSTLEIARQNDILPLSLLYVALFPVYAPHAAYWGGLITNPQGIAKQLKPVDNSAAEARLKRLIAERQVPVGGKQEP